MIDIDIIQQIVGINSTIVTRHFNLVECNILLPYFIALNHKWSDIGSHPDILFFIFTDTINIGRRIGKTILINEIVIFEKTICRWIITEYRWILPRCIDKPKITTTIKEHTPQSGK